MNKRPNENGFVPDQAPMDQVRDLLFGSQLKEMEIRLQRQEDKFQRELGDMRDSLKQRLDSLENFMKSEISTLLHRLKEEQEERNSVIKVEQRERLEGVKAEQRERAECMRNEQRERNEAVSQITKELNSAAETFERRVAKVASTLDAAERELRQLLLSESNSLSGKIEEKYQDALKALAKSSSQIRHDMVYRTSLSSMLTEVVVKLSGAWSPDVGQRMNGGTAEERPAPQEVAEEKGSEKPAP